MTWTDERVSELIRLWEAGHTASHIGKVLGVSKNSVVGKAHRMQLESRPSPIKRACQGIKSNRAASGDGEPASRPRGVEAPKSGAQQNRTQRNGSHRIEPRAAEPRPVESRAAEPRPVEPRPVEPRAVEPRHVERRARVAVRAPVAPRPLIGGAGPKCSWPIGDPRDPDFHFCGAPAQAGKPYCEQHCARAYISRNRSESEAA